MMSRSPKTDRGGAATAARDEVPDLAPAALAIASGARLSVGPSGGLATRAPAGIPGDEAQRFIEDTRRTLRPLLRSAEARAALLRILAPWPQGWGSAYGAAVVALLWAEALARLRSPLLLRPGHLVTDADRFVDSLRAAVLAGPTWTDRRAGLRWAARTYTGALAADLDSLDAALVSFQPPASTTVTAADPSFALDAASNRRPRPTLDTAHDGL